MTDTPRSVATLQALLANNAAKAISPQDLRDFLVTALPTGRVTVAAADAPLLTRYQADFTCDGTDDQEEIALAIALLPSGGMVTLSDGTFNITARTTVTTDNLRIKGTGQTVLRQAADAQVIIAQGSAAVAESLLAANGAANATTVTLAAGQGALYAAGNWIMVLSDAHTEGSKFGEVQQIESVATDTLTLRGRLRAAYTTADAAAVKKLTPVDGFELSGVVFENAVPATYSNTFLGLRLCRNFKIADVRMRGSRVAGLSLNASFHGSVSGMYVNDFDATIGYGVQVSGACEGVHVSRLVGHRVRHAFTTVAAAAWNSNGLDHGIPRAITVADSSAFSCHSTGFDTHEQGEAIHFTNCTAQGNVAGGFQVRATSAVLSGCSALYNGSNGIRVVGFAGNGSARRVILEGCLIEGNLVGIEITSGVTGTLVNGCYASGNGTALVDGSGTTEMGWNVGF